MDTVRVIGSVVGLAIVVFLLVDVWRSNASTGTKVVWSIFAFFCNIVTLIVWLAWGRRQAFNAPSQY